jgi:hypothetical protein
VVDPATVTVEHTTHPAFGPVAAAAVRQMRFYPALIGRRPVRVWVSLPILFQLRVPDEPKPARSE